MTTEYASDKYVPTSISSVPEGWAVVYIDPGQGVVMKVAPMFGWAIWTRSVVSNDTNEVIIAADDPFVEAVVSDDGWPACARELETDTMTISGYISPGEQAPKVGDVDPNLAPGQKGRGNKPPGRGKGRRPNKN